VPKEAKVVTNLDHLVDVEGLLGLSCVCWKHCITVSKLINY
jgi:hypothetical protein